MKPLLVLILSVITTTAWARLGENAEQLVKRYGLPIVGADTEMLHFKKNDIYVTAILWKGTCHCICFSNYPPGSRSLDDLNLSDKIRSRFYNEPSTPSLTQEQIQKLLDANGGGSKWEPESSSSRWRTKNGWYLARMDSHTLRIETKEFSQRKPEGKDQPKYDPAKRTEGF